jgi:hypothetical protein
MARTPNPSLHELWRDRIRRQETSGLTIAQFCDRERVARSKFHAWKSRLRLMQTGRCREQTPALPTFLPVTVRVLETPLSQPLPIEADLPNGIRLRIPMADSRLACNLIRLIARARTQSGGSQ